MLKTSGLLGLILIAAVFFACKKDAPYDAETQLEIDDAIIAKYLIDSPVTSILKHSSGLYYKIVEEGSGSAISETDTLFGRYSMKILRDTTFLSRSDDSTFRFTLTGFFEGWKIGAGLIRKGGEIRMIVPSPLGYQQREVTTPRIPPNSILDIILEIDSVKPENTND